MANIITTLRNIGKIEELRSRLLFTLLALIAVRIGSFITIPGVDVEMLKASGGALGDNKTIFGLYGQSYKLFLDGAVGGYGYMNND